MAIDRKRALKLLSCGVKETVVAEVLGCSLGAVSVLCAEDSFSEELSKLRVQTLTEQTDRAASIESIEDLLIEKLKDAVGMMYKPRDLLHAFQVVNAAKKSGAARDAALLASGNIQVATIVNLTLPASAINYFSQGNEPAKQVDPNQNPEQEIPNTKKGIVPAYRVNRTGEVIEAGGRSFLTATPQQLLENLAKSKEGSDEHEAAREVRNLLKRTLAPGDFAIAQVAQRKSVGS